jgi:hypothetical protein
MSEKTAQKQYPTRAALFRSGGQICRAGGEGSEEGYERQSILQGQLL